MSDVIERLRTLSPKDQIRVETDEGEYTCYIVSDVDYVSPDKHGSGTISLEIELDSTVHDIPSDELPTETGSISGHQPIGSTEIDTPLLSIWEPITAEDDESLIVDDEWVQKGVVEHVEVLD